MLKSRNFDPNRETLIFLHGLLGCAQDWLPVWEFLPEVSALALDLPGHGQNAALVIDDFDAANRWLAAQIAALKIQNYRLVGYSLGGRWALSFAASQPIGLQGLFLESAHIGLSSESERQARITHDQRWAQRFEHEPLAQLLSDWYQQAVFSDLDESERQTLIAQRLVANGDGLGIAMQLRATSLGKQADLRPFLAHTNLAIGYAVGTEDHKFQQVAIELAQLNPATQIYPLTGGHNLHHATPQLFAQTLRQWLSEVGMKTSPEKDFS